MRSVVLGAMDSIHVNSVTDRSQAGGHWVIKRRHAGARPIARIANFYFRLAGAPLRFVCDCPAWQQWELNCFRMLNSDEYAVATESECAIRMQRIPGENLWKILRAQKITRKIVRSAGTELRRAHQFRSRELRGAWSHGDASMSNFIYDASTGRARLIDFEVMHDANLSSADRHADDLLVFLVDLAGFVSERRWLSLALAFLNAYGESLAIDRLRSRLRVPRGLLRIWWNVRANGVSAKVMSRRLGALNAELARQSAGRVSSSFLLPGKATAEASGESRRSARRATRERRWKVPARGE